MKKVVMGPKPLTRKIYKKIVRAARPCNRTLSYILGERDYDDHVDRCIQCSVGLLGEPRLNPPSWLWQKAFLYQWTLLRVDREKSKPWIKFFYNLAGETHSVLTPSLWLMPTRKVPEWLPEFGGDGRRTQLCSDSAQGANDTTG